MTPRSWSDLLGRTWLRDPGLIVELDAWVKACLAGHRSLPLSQHETVAPTSVSVLVEDIAFLGEALKWFWATAAICLLTELIVAAESGGVLGTGLDRLASRNWQLGRDLEALQILRNSVFHPALQSEVAGSGVPHIALLRDYLENEGEADLADGLARNWSSLATRPYTEYALRKLDAAGIAYARMMNMRRSGEPAPASRKR